MTLIYLIKTSSKEDIASTLGHHNSHIQKWLKKLIELKMQEVAKLEPNCPK